MLISIAWVPEKQQNDIRVYTRNHVKNHSSLLCMGFEAFFFVLALHGRENLREEKSAQQQLQFAEVKTTTVHSTDHYLHTPLFFLYYK